MKSLAPLLAGLLGRSQIDNFRAACAEVDAELAPILAHQQEGYSFPEKIVAALEKYRSDPTDENFHAWIELEAKRGAYQNALLDMGSFYDLKKQALLSKKVPSKLLAAIDEIEAELNLRESQIAAEDVARSEKLGVPVRSSEAFARIQSYRDSLDKARFQADTAIKNAVSELNTVIGQ